MRRRGARRHAAELARQAREQEFIRSKPLAMQLTIVNNGPEHGWKWLCFTYDPDGARIVAGQVEGVMVPHGMQSGYGTRDEALIEGIVAVRKGGWDGDVVIHETEPAHG